MHKWPNISPKGTFLGKKCRRVVVSTQNACEKSSNPTIKISACWERPVCRRTKRKMHLSNNIQSELSAAGQSETLRKPLMYPLELYPGPTIPSRPYAAKGSSMNDDDDEAALREVGGQEEGKLLLVPRFDHFFPLSLSHFSCFDKLFPWYCHTFSLLPVCSRMEAWHTHSSLKWSPLLLGPRFQSSGSLRSPRLPILPQQKVSLS